MSRRGGGGRKLGNHPLPPLRRMAGTKGERPNQRLGLGVGGATESYLGSPGAERVRESFYRPDPRYTRFSFPAWSLTGATFFRAAQNTIPPDPRRPNLVRSLPGPGKESARRSWRQHGSCLLLPQPPPHSLTVPTHPVPLLSVPPLRPILAPRKQAWRQGARRVPGVGGHLEDSGGGGRG